ncbi:hypothetical protein NL463_29280, partial [Klebsiella pneumoniae]|nr:hypothetical protein [Klebsiella pneumoniae]
NTSFFAVMPIMQAKEKSSYQTEDEKRGNGWKYLRIRRSLKGCLIQRGCRSRCSSRADEAFMPHPPVYVD